VPSGKLVVFVVTWGVARVSGVVLHAVLLWYPPMELVDGEAVVATREVARASGGVLHSALSW
jgi:hypothetical protein